MNRLFYVLVILLLVGIFSYDFFSRVYQPLSLKQPEAVLPKSHDFSSRQKVPDILANIFDEWRPVSTDDAAIATTEEKKVDTGVIGHYQISLLAIYASKGQRTSVLSIVDTTSGVRQLAKLKANENWSDIKVIRVDPRVVTMELNTETINLRLFDAASQRTQG